MVFTRTNLLTVINNWSTIDSYCICTPNIYIKLCIFIIMYIYLYYIYIAPWGKFYTFYLPKTASLCQLIRLKLNYIVSLLFTYELDSLESKYTITRFLNFGILQGFVCDKKNFKMLFWLQTPCFTCIITLEICFLDMSYYIIKMGDMKVLEHQKNITISVRLIFYVLGSLINKLSDRKLLIKYFKFIVLTLLIHYLNTLGNFISPRILLKALN